MLNKIHIAFRDQNKKIINKDVDILELRFKTDEGEVITISGNLLLEVGRDKK